LTFRRGKNLRVPKRAVLRRCVGARAVRFTLVSLVAASSSLTLCAAAADTPSAPYEITKSNVARYEEILPPSIARRVELGQYELKVVPVDVERFRANYSERFWKASAANAGKYAVDLESGGLAEAGTGKIPEHLFGLPFPAIDPGDPHAGTKVIHNYRMRKMQADGNLHEFDLTDVKLDGEVLRTVKISLAHRYYVGSTSPPPDKLPDNTEMRQLAAAIFPKDLEGVGILTWRFNDWTTWDHVWAYLPTIRRVRRMRSSTRGDLIPGFEVQGDDADCYDNKTTYFNWKLVREAEVIGPVGSDTPYAYSLHAAPPSRWTMELPYNNAVFETPGAKGAGWWPLKNVFIRRPVWIVEGVPKDPYYESGKILLYIDREMYHGYYKITFSKAGELYRTNLCGQAWGKTPDGSFAAPTALLMVGINEKEQRGTPAGRYTKETFERNFAADWFTPKHLDDLSQ
jgi:hypothetical protein